MAITTRQKLRPAFFSERYPNAAPKPAIKIISQFNHPSNGINPMKARTRAMRPRRNAIKFAMRGTVAGFG